MGFDGHDGALLLVYAITMLPVLAGVLAGSVVGYLGARNYVSPERQSIRVNVGFIAIGAVIGLLAGYLWRGLIF